MHAIIRYVDKKIDNSCNINPNLIQRSCSTGTHQNIGLHNGRVITDGLNEEQLELVLDLYDVKQ